MGVVPNEWRGIGGIETAVGGSQQRVCKGVVVVFENSRVREGKKRSQLLLLFLLFFLLLLLFLLLLHRIQLLLLVLDVLNRIGARLAVVELEDSSTLGEEEADFPVRRCFDGVVVASGDKEGTATVMRKGWLATGERRERTEGK
jgi:hypothetical protein